MYRKKYIQKENKKGNYVQQDRESKNDRMESSLELNPQARENKQNPYKQC